MISIFLLAATVSDDYGKREAEVQSFTKLSPALPCCGPTPHDPLDKKVAQTVTAVVHFWLWNHFLGFGFCVELCYHLIPHCLGVVEVLICTSHQLAV